MDRLNYVRMLRDIYLTANSSDTENPPYWMHGRECAIHCQAIEIIVRDMGLSSEWLETLK